MRKHLLPPLLCDAAIGLYVEYLFFYKNKISEKVSRGILGFEEMIFFKKQASNSYMG